MNYLILKKIINENDPVGLLAMNAPEDEYDPEINNILKKLTKNYTLEDIKKIVFEEFIKWFGKNTLKNCEQQLHRIAEDIYNQQ